MKIKRKQFREIAQEAIDEHINKLFETAKEKGESEEKIGRIKMNELMSAILLMNCLEKKLFGEKENGKNDNPKQP